MEMYVVLIDDSGDAPDYHALPCSQILHDLGMVKKGVLGGEDKSLLFEQWRDPMRICAIYLPGQTEKDLALLFGLDLPYLNPRCGHLR